MNENQNKIITENLNLYYGENHALKDINMKIRAGLVVFPFADRLGGHAHLLCQPVLGPSQPLSVLHDPFSQCLFHRNSSLVLMAQLCHKSPQKAITYPLIGCLFLSSGG